MREFIKNEKVLNLVKKAMQNGTISYEEINSELPDDFPMSEIPTLIEGMEKQGIKVVDEHREKEPKKEEEKSEKKDGKVVSDNKNSDEEGFDPGEMEGGVCVATEGHGC